MQYTFDDIQINWETCTAASSSSAAFSIHSIEFISSSLENLHSAPGLKREYDVHLQYEFKGKVAFLLIIEFNNATCHFEIWLFKFFLV